MRNFKISEFTSHVKVCIREINLDNILNTGQVFRWKKYEDTWFGVIRNKVWVLRQENAFLYYQSYPLTSKTYNDKGGILDNEVTNHNVINTAQAAELKDYFNLQHSLSDISSNWEHDTHLLNLFSEHTGLRLIRQDPMECLLAFITSSCNNIPRISSLMLKLSQLSDRKCTISDTTFHGLPDILQYQDSSMEQTLRDLGFGYRAKYITSAMRDVVKRGGVEWLEKLRHVGLEEARRELRSLAGVGPKVASCVCLMSLDKQNAVPIDTHIHQVAVKYYKRSDKPLTPALHNEIELFFQQTHGKYAGWAQAYLFYSNSNKSDKKPIKKSKKVDKKDNKNSTSNDKMLKQSVEKTLKVRSVGNDNLGASRKSKRLKR